MAAGVNSRPFLPIMIAVPVGRLMEFLTAPGQDVRITVKTRKAKGEMAVVAG